jgi:glucosamine--fructose-6-phosphate aminotransferase (isomerizing)
MCGIIGYSGGKKALPVLMRGLKLLEYRGYDSSGVTLGGAGRLRTYKKAGKLSELEAVIPAEAKETAGIGHTRWATHGGPTDANAHPHLGSRGKVAVAHNGIIDNHAALRRELEAGGAKFASETDTEVVAQLIEAELASRPAAAGAGGKEAAGREAAVGAVLAALARLQGTFGLAILFADQPGLVIGARNGSPLVVGLGDGECFLASDPAAFGGAAREAVFLRDGEMAVIGAGTWETRDFGGARLEREAERLDAAAHPGELGESPDWLLKEILEEPEAAARALGNGGRLLADLGTAKLGGLGMEGRELLALERVVLFGMGSGLHAAMIGARLLEDWARLPAQALDASELRSSNPIVDAKTLYVAVSQSGETADTIGAAREILTKGGRVVGVINAVGSSLARLCGEGVYVHAGAEVSVATTKAFVNQALVLALLALLLGRMRSLSLSRGRRIVADLEAFPGLVSKALALVPDIARIAQRVSGEKSAFVVGRGPFLPAALECALKLKELSYVHAEGLAAGSLKHGPLALVSDGTPVYVLAFSGDGYDKAMIAASEVRARGGFVVLVTDRDDPDAKFDERLLLPSCGGEGAGGELAPILAVLPFQLLGRELALLLGRDVDRPRNLAKSVTTE